MSPRFLKPAPLWRVDVWETADAVRSRREFVLQDEAMRAFDDACAGDVWAARLCRRGHADRATRDAGANTWIIVEEYGTPI